MGAPTLPPISRDLARLIDISVNINIPVSLRKLKILYGAKFCITKKKKNFQYRYRGMLCVFSTLAVILTGMVFLGRDGIGG